MREILLRHLERYPKMQVTDAVKLLFQSEFGGGHMIADPEKSLNWIKREWEQLREDAQRNETYPENEREQSFQETPVLEKIGGGLCRMSLRVLDEGLSPETLNRMFVKTAEKTTGRVEAFEEKLDILRELCREGKTSFGLDELEEYLISYKKEGYPPVSHSECYHIQYHPAYRVVSDEYARYYPVFLQIDRALAATGAEELVRAKDSMRAEQSVTAAIDGMCGSGKSTLGKVLEEIYDCRLFHMDDFFLRPEQRTPERLAEPGGNVDYERFQKEILAHLADPEGLTYQVYNCGIQALDSYVTVPYKRLNIIEGAYSCHPYFGEPYDLQFFCKISPEEQVRRILKRNGPEMLERFQQVWIPMENRYFETFGIEEKCRLIRL